MKSMNKITKCFLLIVCILLFDRESTAQEEPVVYVPVVSSELFVVGAPNPQTGLFYSRDNGQSWDHTGWKNIRAFGVAVDAHSNVIYIASGNGVIKTTDGGDSWRVMTDWRVTEVMDVQIDHSNPDHVYIATAYGAYRSVDGGWTWTEQNNGLLQTFLTVIVIDRKNPDILYVGGESGLYRSTDRADTWEHIGFEGKPVRAIAQSIHSPEVYLVGTEDDGIFRSTDNGATWERVRNGLQHETFYTIQFDPIDENIIYAAGFETGIYKSVNGGTAWQRYTSGLTNRNVPAVAVHPKNNNIVFAGTNGGGLFRSMNGGRTWQHVGLKSAEIYSIMIQ
jgi:photosystem II stability/assembly factor-like uncharacterized protein